MSRVVPKLLAVILLLAPPAETASAASDDAQDALERAAEYLVHRQSADGAWRSDVYGPFKEGDALTAHVAAALAEIATQRQTAEQAKAVAKARDYLASLVTADGTIRTPEHGLAYPLYTAAGAVTLLSYRENDLHLRARDAWVNYLRERQLNESQGWSETDPQYGGWGYAGEPTRKPGDGRPLGDLAEPNLSATVFALSALRAAGVAVDDPAVRGARRFVEHCQNFASEGAPPDVRFDDGGFVFVLDDPVRNKAGVAGVDSHGRERFTSYGSATADGLRAFVLCGAREDEPRVVAAWKWLVENFSADSHPGDYAADRRGAQQSVYFYYCHSVAALLKTTATNSATMARSQRFASKLLTALVERQQADGSWRNAAVDVREDDPLVATPLAALAVARCHELLLMCPAAP